MISLSCYFTERIVYAAFYVYFQRVIMCRKIRTRQASGIPGAEQAAPAEPVKRKRTEKPVFSDSLADDMLKQTETVPAK